MNRLARVVVLALFALSCTLFVIKMRARFHTSLPPLEISFWYWHTPFRLSTTETSQLQAMGVQQLFVRAGTFHRDGDGIRCLHPQTWDRTNGTPPVHLVFHFAGDMTAHFAKMSTEAMVIAVLETTRIQRTLAEGAGVHVAGVQIDFDCPTRRLSSFARLLRALRSPLQRENLKLSITTLPTWYSNEGIDELLAAVDFSAPQFYESRTPRTLDDLVTVSETRLLKRELNAAEQRGMPFYAGLPAYGHGMLFDSIGKFAGLYPALTPRDALRHPSFRLERSFAADMRGKPATSASYIGEDILDFVAVKPGRAGRGKGYHLLFDLPTQALVSKQIATVRSNRSPNCRGIILFRFPDAAATMSVPLPAVASALRGEVGEPILSVVCRAISVTRNASSTQPFSERDAIELTAAVTNVGTASASIGSDAISVMLLFDRPGLEEASSGEFDTLASGFDSSPFSSPSPSGIQPVGASLPRANTLRFGRQALAAGETATIGPIGIPPGRAMRVRGFWSAVGPGGFVTRHGEIQPFQIRQAQESRK